MMAIGIRKRIAINPTTICLLKFLFDQWVTLFGGSPKWPPPTYINALDRHRLIRPVNPLLVVKLFIVFWSASG